MINKIERNYLEIRSLNDLKDINNIPDEFIIKYIDPPDFLLNKFFYKNIGKVHRWVDRLTWTDQQWIEYTSDKDVKTYILKKKR